MIGQSEALRIPNRGQTLALLGMTHCGHGYLDEHAAMESAAWLRQPRERRLLKAERPAQIDIVLPATAGSGLLVLVQCLSYVSSRGGKINMSRPRVRMPCCGANLQREYEPLGATSQDGQGALGPASSAKGISPSRSSSTGSTLPVKSKDERLSGWQFCVE